MDSLREEEGRFGRVRFRGAQEALVEGACHCGRGRVCAVLSSACFQFENHSFVQLQILRT